MQALLSWLQHEPETRKKDAGRLLALVKLPLLSPAVSQIKKDKIINGKCNFLKLVLNIKFVFLVHIRQHRKQRDVRRPEIMSGSGDRSTEIPPAT